MEASSHPVRMTTNPSKRSACDRCRNQKLRCPREEHSSEACERCIRAGAFCVTSSPRPLGRPSRTDPRSSSGYTSRSRRRRETKCGDDSSSQLQTDASFPTPPSAHSGRGSTSPWPHTDLSHLFGLPPLDANSPLVSNMPTPPDPSFSPDLPPLSWDSFGLHSQRRMLNLDEQMGYQSERDDVSEDYQPPAQTDHKTSILSLASLNGRIAHLVYQITTHPWESIIASIACPESAISTPTDPLSGIFQCTADFIEILQSLKPEPIPNPLRHAGHSFSIDAAMPQSTSSSPMIDIDLRLNQSDLLSYSSALDTSAILNIISCYLQISQFHDSILSRAYGSLRSMADEDIASFHMLQGLELRNRKGGLID